MSEFNPQKGNGAKVWLVGAGPGDPDLLTMRAARLIKEADIIVHDRLVGERVLALASPLTELVNVGKRPGHPHMKQEEISHLLVKLARRGRKVVRLKGGDPFIFGRGGEEAETLRRHGVEVEIVPGITAAQGAAASLGLPLTMRSVSSSLRYVTGHMREGSDIDEMDWDGLADNSATLVIYMGKSNIRRFAARLMEHGRSPATPAIAIASATCERQDFTLSPLGELAENVKNSSLEGPVLFIVGEVVALASHLHELKREANENLSHAAAAFLAAE
jgi:uroporphyrin-III C-methyltransferase